MVKLPFSFHTNKEAPSFLTIDIGSDTVKCMIFEIAYSEGSVSANIVGVGKYKILPELNAIRNGVIIDSEVVEEALLSAINQAQEEYGKKVTNVVYGVSGELSYGIMTTVRLTRAKDLPITEKELNEIFDNIHEAARDQALNEVLEVTGDSEMDIELITSSVIYTKVDDKYVKSAEGLTGQKMEIALFSAFCPSFHTAELLKLSKRLGLRIVAIGSQMYSLVKSLELSKGKGLDCVVIDVGGNVTDVGVVFGGGIVSTRNLSIAGAQITEHLRQKLNLSFVEAENKKLEYSFGNLSEDESLAVQEGLNGIIEVWLDGIELLFMEFTGVKTFASKVYLVGGSADLPDIYDYIAKEPWTRSIPFKTLPEFTKVVLKDLHFIVDTTGKAQSSGDIIPASLSVIYLEGNNYI